MNLWRWLWFKRQAMFRGWPLAYPNQVKLIAAAEAWLWERF